jgi:hypothetical protein
MATTPPLAGTGTQPLLATRPCKANGGNVPRAEVRAELVAGCSTPTAVGLDATGYKGWRPVAILRLDHPDVSTAALGAGRRRRAC